MLSNSLRQRRFHSIAHFVMVIGLAVSCLSALSAYGQGTNGSQDEKTYSVQRVYKAGDVDVYHMKVSQKINGPQTDNKLYTFVIDVVMKVTTKSAAKGAATLLQEYTKAEAIANDKPLEMLTMMPKLTIKIEGNGGTQVTAEGGEEPVVQQMADSTKSMLKSQVAMLPPKPVKIGDTWKAEVNVPVTGGIIVMSIDSQLDGVETIDGAQALRIKIHSNSTGGAQPDTKLTSDGTLFVDPTTGKVIKITSKATGMAGGSKLDSEMTMEKGAPEDAKPSKKSAGPK